MTSTNCYQYHENQNSARAMKREKREVGFNFRLISIWVGFISIQVRLIFWVGLILNEYVMSYLSCK